MTVHEIHNEEIKFINFTNIYHTTAFITYLNLNSSSSVSLLNIAISYL